MRPNLEFLKLIIRLLILLILFVMLFIISAFLYSAKYWPDMYNYINANITIKRIPTISELHPVIVHETDYTTELYSTTDGSDYLEVTTNGGDFDLNFDDFMNEGADDRRRKRQIPVEEMKVNIEIVKANYDYVFDFDVTTESFIENVVNETKFTTTEPNHFEIITKYDDCVKENKENSSGRLLNVSIKHISLYLHTVSLAIGQSQNREDVIKMFVKLNLLVICAVLLNFGDCNNCDGVFKCVMNKVGDAISANLNVTIDNIEDTSENISILDKLQDNNDNLLTNLTRFLVQKFSGLIIENPVLKTLGKNTEIYIQTFKINESAYENKPIDNTIKSDMFDMKSNDTNFHNNTSIIVLREDNTSNNYNKSVINEPMYEKTATNSTIRTYLIETNNSDINSVDKINKSKFEHTTYNVNYTTKQGTVTSVSLNADDIPEKKEDIEVTIENFTEIPAVTVKVSNKNNSDIYAKNGMNIQLQVSTHKINMISETINVRDNYIDDTNDLFRDINEPVHDNMTDYLDIDYVDMYKDTTNEDVQYTSAVYIPTTTVATKIMIDQKTADKIDSVYPWIATVFIMNRDNKQFEYICDGILLSKRVVLTAARCVIKSNVTVDADNILIIMGKRSLQSTGANEKVLRVKSIKIHDNFVSNGEMTTPNDGDLAIAVLAEPVVLNIDIQPAPLGLDDKSAPLATATTGWHASGPLQPLYLELESTEKNIMDVNCKKLFCATLGDSETTCPSYGGLLIERQDDYQWRLKGIASGSPTNTGVCFNKHLTFTKIENYFDWIKENLQQTSSI
ncbi:uncharacterized protein LOC134749647 [Cydia strobilella]|uniref:uncharacterized protein LOC134749647 n=1 Tax=Cydia strobilella TaxID=1100964 RepID=UPI00300476C2